MNGYNSIFTRFSRRARVILLVALLAVGAGSGCSVYFNTFFNCKKAFNRAEKARKDAGPSVQSSRRATPGVQHYNTAIEKAQKVVENYPNSKYYDDALYILAVSFFHTGQYSRSERRFRELIANYADSKYMRESNLYLAKAKLALGDVEDAKSIFEEIFQRDYKRQFKAEAAEALGEYHFERQEFNLSRDYFLAIRDSLGNDMQQRMAQRYLADGYFESFQFGEALGGYLQLLGMDPDKDERYHALYQAAICSYRLARIDDGMEYLEQLIEDEDYYDSLGVLQLTVAEGFEYEDDLIGAEAMYREVAETTERNFWQARAYYRLGLIYQFDYDQLSEAKDFYDQAKSLFGGRGTTDEARDALQRSTDIGKLETFREMSLELDSSATQAMIDEAAYNQYRLAEL
ncbi:tetratricopeptide repeat protein, partial [candidate division GN15 bacterium]|nr:tetratricopeptide repeat protein [candidate division GN15 bacterium]